MIDDKGFHPFPIFALILSGHCWEALKKGQGITISSFLYFLLFMLKDPPIISFVNSFRRFRRGFSDIYKKCWINQVETRASDSNLRYYGISHCSTDLTLEGVLSTVAFASLDEFQLYLHKKELFSSCAHFPLDALHTERRLCIVQPLLKSLIEFAKNCFSSR